MKKYIICCLFLLFVSNSHALTNSSQSTITQITIGNTFARIRLASMTNMEGCTNQSYYYLDLSNDQNKGVLSVALTAKVSQTPVIVQGDGCSNNNYPLINHFYLN